MYRNGFFFLSALGTACAPAGAFTSRGYESSVYPLRVGYRSGDEQNPAFFSSNWELQNYEKRRGKFVIPRRGDYTERVEIDVGGLADASRTLPSQELLFQHTKERATIALVHEILPSSERRRKLDVLSRDLLDSLRTETVRIRREAQATAIVEVETAGYSVTIKKEEPYTVGGANGHRILAELSAGENRKSVDRLLDMVVLRPSYSYIHTRHGITQAKDKHYCLPVTLIAWLRARPERFEGLQNDFEQFLARVEFAESDWSCAGTTASKKRKER